MVVGLGLEACGLLLIGALVTDTSGYRTLVGCLSPARESPSVPRDDRYRRSVGPDETAIASGISNTFRQVGAVFGVAIATAIFAAEGSYRTASEFVDGLQPRLHHPRRPVRNRGTRGPAPAGALGRQPRTAPWRLPPTSTHSVTRPSTGQIGSSRSHRPRRRYWRTPTGKAAIR